MNELKIIKQDGGAYIDSREVAETIGKRHDHLLRDIGKYCEVIARGGLPKIGESDFFVESSYTNTQNKQMPRYLISKMGCEMVANKLTGEKGILFTAAYVARFNELEAAEQAEFEAIIAHAYKQESRLGEINACARIVVKGMKCLGATPEEIMSFLRIIYEPHGIAIDFEPGAVSAPRWRTATEIAKKLGVFSLNGKPHSQAVACILNEIIFICDAHKRVVAETYGDYVGTRTLYDDLAVLEAMQWLVDNDFPEEVYGFGRTYHVQYTDD